jgi:hemerythrin-like domain-containing protein
MPVTIGAPRERGFDEPLGVLSDCHRRVEKFLSILVAIANLPQPDSPLDQAQKAALATALDYFRNAAPKHTADEEESLFPRLRKVAGARELELLHRLEADHEGARVDHDAIERIGRKWLERSTVPAAESAEYAAAVSRLAAMYREHIELEETQVFPTAQRVLTPSEQQALGVEMAARRGVTVSKS